MSCLKRQPCLTGLRKELAKSVTKMMDKKKNYVHYKHSVFEFIKLLPHTVKVAVLTRFELIEYGLDNHWIDRCPEESLVVVERNGKKYEFQCVYKNHDGQGLIEVIKAGIVYPTDIN